MQLLGKWALIAGLFFIVIAVLNISNQAVNDLTTQDSGKFLAVSMQDGSLDIDFLGKSYAFTLDKPIQENYLNEGMGNIAGQIEAHFIKLWRIFKVLFL